MTYATYVATIDYMVMLSYESYSEARAHLKDLLDAADRGLPALVRRDRTRAAVVDAERLRRFLAAVRPAKAAVVAEGGGWSAFLPDLPISAEGNTFDGAIEELAIALREYADDWQDHLSDAANHRDNWGLVQLVSLSDDEQLRAWLVGEAA